MDFQNFVIQLNPVTFTCVLCNCYMPCYYTAYQHLYASNHIEALTRYGHHLSHEMWDRYYCDLCSCRIIGFPNVLPHLESRGHQCLLDSDDDSTYGRSDYNSDLTTTASSIASLSDASYSKSFVVEVYGKHLCVICNYSSWDKMSMDRHVKSYNHADAVRIYGHDIYLHDYGSADCFKCKCAISGYMNVYNHLKGQLHQASMIR